MGHPERVRALGKYGTGFGNFSATTEVDRVNDLAKAKWFLTRKDISYQTAGRTSLWKRGAAT